MPPSNHPPTISVSVTIHVSLEIHNHLLERARERGTSLETLMLSLLSLDVPVMPAPGAQLSPRELEVIELLVQGQTNKEIATTIGTSVHTAKAHVQRILSKLDVDCRSQAAVLWVRMTRRHTA